MQSSTYQHIDGGINAFACPLAASPELQEQRPELSVVQPTRYISQQRFASQQGLVGNALVYLWTWLRLGVCETNQTYQLSPAVAVAAAAAGLLR